VENPTVADKSHDKHWQRAIKMSFEKEPQRRQIQKAKKQLKPNRQPKPTRRRDWLPETEAGSDDFDFESAERIMPRGERERRRTLLAAALLDMPETLSTSHEPPHQVEVSSLRGTVVEVSSGLCRVDVAGQAFMCGLRGSLSAEETGFTNVVAVGDDVLISADSSGWGVVKEVLPRRTILARPDVFYGHLRQIIVANAEQLLIVASWRNPTLWPELIDRYLIAAQRNKLSPIICINKIDLAEDPLACQVALQPYQALGHPVIFASALTGVGLDSLAEILRGRITALAGLSGVGKSSLLSAVQPNLQLRTGVVSEASGEGRHTTTQVTMLPLAMGGFVVDTPGIREFGLSGLSPRDLIQFYPDLGTVAAGCRFADCSHRHEPNCAVKTAVTAGKLPLTRYDSYQKIYEDLL
jgi:ribosome biogenesis GTPase